MLVKTKGLLIGSVLVVLLTLVIAAVYRVSVVAQQLTELEANRFRSGQLSEQLRQSSDNLTQMARLYVTTAEPRFEDYYNQILAIRSGESPRPAVYDSSYWYRIILTSGQPLNQGEMVSLRSMLEQIELTEGEFALLAEAENISNQLTLVEFEAFNAVKGLFKDEQGNYLTAAEPDLELAASLLRSDAYFRTKSEIMSLAEKFSKVYDDRLVLSMEKYSGYSNSYLYILAILLFSILFLLFYYAYFLSNKVLNPIRLLARESNKLGEGDYLAKSQDVNRKDEIGKLFRSFSNMLMENKNAMSDLREATEEAQRSRNEISDINNQLEEKISERTKQLKENEELLLEIVNNSITVIYLKDIDGKYLLVNRYFEDLFNVTNKELKGRTDYDVFPAEFADALRVNDLEVIEKNAPIKREEVLPQGGKNTTYISVKFPIHKADGSIFAVCGISTNITQLKDEEKKRASLEQKLLKVKNLEAVGQLTGGIAHDFNNIMGIIQGNLELLALTYPDDDVALSFIKSAIKGTNRGSELTKRLLNVSRRRARQAEPTSVNSFIENLKELIVKSLTVSIDVETQLAEEIWPTLIDPGDLEDAILNLVINARDAMPAGGQLIISTNNKRIDKEFVAQHSSASIGDYVEVSVSDNGLGMDKEIQEKVFEPFFTTKKLGQGTGLGLAIIYGFINRSGGFIVLDSKLGVGTKLSMYLPRSESTETASTQNKIAKSDAGETLSGEEVILIVDDEEELIKIADRHLQGLGYKTLTAINAQEALDILATHPEVDLLFSDIIMPGQIDGFELAELARSNYPDLKVLFTTGFTNRQLGEESGLSPSYSSNMLKKPYSSIDLTIGVRKALDE